MREDYEPEMKPMQRAFGPVLLECRICGSTRRGVDAPECGHRYGDFRIKVENNTGEHE